MDKRIYISAAVILLFALLALYAYNTFEIYHEKRRKPPSRDAYNNIYLAMERWLNETGHPVRIENEFFPEKILIPEKVAIIYAKAIEWKNANEFFIPWIEQGNSLVICLDYPSYENEIDENLSEFLSGLGIDTGRTSIYGDYGGENIPDFRGAIYFNIDEGAEDVFTIIDNEGYIRLVEVFLGQGTLTVTGFPSFMYNYNLNTEANARLAWRLTGERADNMGVLFVRENENRYAAKSIFGKIMERGNLVPVLTSAFLTIILGFWMVIPVFGLVFEEKEKSSRPIRERFAAEISFFKKYKALGYYLEVYDRELQTEQGQTVNNVKDDSNYNYGEIINKLRRVNNGTDSIKHRIGSHKT